MKKINFDRNERRKKRVSSGLKGTKDRPKISVFRSNKYFYAQAIDDEKRHTIAYFSSFKLNSKDSKLKKTEEAKLVGKGLAQELSKQGIKKAILDRRNYAYLGRVKAFSEGLREGGLEI